MALVMVVSLWIIGLEVRASVTVIFSSRPVKVQIFDGLVTNVRVTLAPERVFARGPVLNGLISAVDADSEPQLSFRAVRPCAVSAEGGAAIVLRFWMRPNAHVLSPSSNPVTILAWTSGVLLVERSSNADLNPQGLAHTLPVWFKNAQLRSWFNSWIALSDQSGLLGITSALFKGSPSYSPGGCSTTI